MTELGDPPAGGSDAGAYCRAIESYLCRKNDGHLIRVAGPAFDLVRGWAEQGIPLKVACRGIDRTFERYYRSGHRRRPVHVRFCEADVLDAFDEWRRALGVPAALGRPEPDGSPPDPDRVRRGGGLPAHLERVVNRLTVMRGGAGADAELDTALERAVREIDAARTGARQLRGERRAALVDRLAAIDAELIARVTSRLDAKALHALEHQAASDLAPFRDRMTPAARQAALAAAVTRLVREAAGLPVIRYETA